MDAERTGAIVEVGLMLATAGAARAGVGSLASRWVSREVAALGSTRVGAALGTALSPAAQLASRAAGASARVLSSPIDDLARGAGAFTLRQGTRAADALGSSAAGRSLLWANNKVLTPLSSAANRGAAALNRTADAAADYFVWANNLGRGRVMATGAEVLEQTTLAQLQAKHAAAKVYDGIRNSVDDVARIAKNTGISEARIARIKDHVFHKLHQLDDGLRRFDPSLRIANAWKRFDGGTFTPRDLRLLRHELYESRFEGIFRTNYATAHDASKWIARRQWARLEGNPAWREVGRLKSPQSISAAAGASAAPPRHGWMPELLRKRLAAGEDFNKINRPRYLYNEVEVLGPGGSKYRLDSYDPVRNEIVFRRLTQFADVEGKTAITYFDEFIRKYPRGAVISDSPFNSAILRGKRLRGDLVFEVPVQASPVPSSVLDAAAKRGIIIRDTAGRVYS